MTEGTETAEIKHTPILVLEDHYDKGAVVQSLTGMLAWVGECESGEISTGTRAGSNYTYQRILIVDRDKERGDRGSSIYATLFDKDRISGIRLLALQSRLRPDQGKERTLMG